MKRANMDRAITIHEEIEACQELVEDLRGEDSFLKVELSNANRVMKGVMIPDDAEPLVDLKERLAVWYEKYIKELEKEFRVLDKEK